MTIECHVSACPFHSFHDDTDNEGPFCFESICQVSPGYIRTVKSYRPDRNDQATIEKEHLGDPDKQTGIYHPDNIRGGQPSVQVIPDTPSNRLWECRVGTYLGDSNNALVHTIYINAMSVSYVWDTLIDIYGKNRKIKSIHIQPYKP